LKQFQSKVDAIERNENEKSFSLPLADDGLEALIKLSPKE
jgi:hypothetical protein